MRNNDLYVPEQKSVDPKYENKVVLGEVAHRHQAKANLYPHNEKNAILFVEIDRKDGVFYEFFSYR
ncbi:hypothetical protein EEL31_18930 [Brevibacillus laterosporus]|nr:hypothetical protein EEL31_18930 [Brevibacillus laterosporus]